MHEHGQLRGRGQSFQRSSSASRHNVACWRFQGGQCASFGKHRYLKKLNLSCFWQSRCTPTAWICCDRPELCLSERPRRRLVGRPAERLSEKEVKQGGERGWAWRETSIPVLIAWATRLTRQSASPSVFHPSVVNLLLTPPSIATHSHSRFLGTFVLLLTHLHTERCIKGVFCPPNRRHRGEAWMCEREKQHVCLVLQRRPWPRPLLLCLWLA